MQFARDTRPLVDALFETNVEPLRQLIKAEPIEAPQKYQERGDAMRFLDANGKIGWKASPRFLTMLADAERDVQDELEDFP